VSGWCLISTAPLRKVVEVVSVVGDRAAVALGNPSGNSWQQEGIRDALHIGLCELASGLATFRYTQERVDSPSWSDRGVPHPRIAERRLAIQRLPPRRVPVAIEEVLHPLEYGTWTQHQVLETNHRRRMNDWSSRRQACAATQFATRASNCAPNIWVRRCDHLRMACVCEIGCRVMMMKRELGNTAWRYPSARERRWTAR
jgi:hypothetical protein